MSFYKFNKNEILHNRIKSYPEVKLLITSGTIHYNNKINETLPVASGSIDLYELNHAGINVYPFITKDGSVTSFRTVSTNNFNQFQYGHTVTGSYPLAAGISRDYYNGADRHLSALKNTINFYGKNSPEFVFSNSSRTLDAVPLNLISIPSIFYGSSIKKGSVELKFYVTGTLVGEAKDERQNGELVQTGPAGSAGSGSIIGLALYNEGFLILTGTTALSPFSEVYPPGAFPSNPSWVNFASTGSAAPAPPLSSFDINFKGVNYIPTLTMMAHAKKGELNHSNNPTYVEHDQNLIKNAATGTTFYREFDEGVIKNVVYSSYADPTGSFEKQTYISKIGIYDEKKNLIAIAKLATPVKKTESRDFTFKLKLDI